MSAGRHRLRTRRRPWYVAARPQGVEFPLGLLMAIASAVFAGLFTAAVAVAAADPPPGPEVATALVVAETAPGRQCFTGAALGIDPGPAKRDDESAMSGEGER